MSESIENNHLEDHEQVDALAEFAPCIREILIGYRQKRQLASVARRLGIHPARLTEMTTRDEAGNYKRKITPYYFGKFIDSGLITVREILGDRRLEDLPDRSRLFFERFMLSRKTIQLVIEAQERGIDVEKILQEILYPSMKHTETLT
ncbi:MAG: hypothetical protein JRF51_11505 [Deltaproteobacteria bacterium]|nr:hypothetical protein [Deltaproteobacteria bacterium]